MTKQSKILLKILELKQDKFFLNEFSNDDFDDTKLSISYATKFIPKIEEDTFIVSVRIIYEYIEDGSVEKLLEFIVHASFLVNNIGKFIKQSGDDELVYDIDDDLLVNLVSLSFSAVRGMLAVKTENTYLKKYILPLVKVKEFLKLTQPKKE